MRKGGESVSTIARTLELTRRTVYKVLERHGLHERDG
jgi:transcriptional regulator of acetoin/glycerol metabolism